MWKKMFHSLPAGEYDLRERMLRSVIQVCGVAVLVGMIEILVLTEDGIVEEGNHETLLEQKGIYHHFYTTANALK